MILFLVLYFSIYGMVHYYAFSKARAALSLSRNTKLVIAGFMLVMITAPVIIRLAERGGVEIGARFWAYLSFTWMGLLFLFVTISAAVDLGCFGASVAGKIVNNNYYPSGVSSKKSLIIQAALVFAIYGYGLFEANDIQKEHLIIANPKIPEQLGKLRIVQISDIHLGLIVRERRLNKILAEVKEARPDLLISAGDLVNGQLNNLSEMAELLAAIQPPLGKIAITGNHEFYAGLKNSLDFIKKTGFTILRHEGMSLNSINIVGVDDKMVGSLGEGYTISERDLLAAQPPAGFTILLKHRPTIDPESIGLFDLQLSGHTHKGQIFPFNIISWFFYPYRAGRLTKLDQGYLYLSRGSGTWGPPIRFLAPPEVTVIDLVHGNSE